MPELDITTDDIVLPGTGLGQFLSSTFDPAAVDPDTVTLTDVLHRIVQVGTFLGGLYTSGKIPAYQDDGTFVSTDPDGTKHIIPSLTDPAPPAS